MSEDGKAGQTLFPDGFKDTFCSVHGKTNCWCMQGVRVDTGDPAAKEFSRAVDEKIILWQDHSHPTGYRPTLTLVKLHNKKYALELSAFGRCVVLPYTKAEVLETGPNKPVLD